MSELQFYLDLAMCYFFFLAIGFVLLLLLVVMVLSHCRRLEQKLNFLIGDDYEIYSKDKRLYRMYK